MTDDVIDFAKEKADRSPHREGPAQCLNCLHKWHAVAPPAAVSLECPSCHSFKGVFSGLANTDGYAQWQCSCGSMFFFIDTEGPYCAHCGDRHDFQPPR